jgi:hypothetical protein
MGHSCSAVLGRSAERVQFSTEETHRGNAAKDGGRRVVVLRSRQDLEARPIGHSDDVGAGAGAEAAARRIVGESALVEKFVESVAGDLDHLELSDVVGEPQLDVLYIVVGDLPADLGLEPIIHVSSFEARVFRAWGTASI